MKIYKDKETINDVKKMFELKSSVSNRMTMKGYRVPFITKSCHQCQYQGVWYQCDCDDPDCEHNKKTNTPSKNPPGQPCSQFVCVFCLQDHYSTIGVSIQELKRICPTCRGICICRRHLRERTSSAALHLSLLLCRVCKICLCQSSLPSAHALLAYCEFPAQQLAEVLA